MLGFFGFWFFFFSYNDNHAIFISRRVSWRQMTKRWNKMINIHVHVYPLLLCIQPFNPLTFLFSSTVRRDLEGDVWTLEELTWGFAKLENILVLYLVHSVALLLRINQLIPQHLNQFADVRTCHIIRASWSPFWTY